VHFRLPPPKEGKPLPVGVAITRALKQYLTKYAAENPEKLEIRTDLTVIGLGKPFLITNRTYFFSYME
jgi:hypothetical protein